MKTSWGEDFDEQWDTLFVTGGDPRFKMQRQRIKSFIRAVVKEEKLGLLEKFTKVVYKLNDKYENDLHGGYDDADALFQRELVIGDLETKLKELADLDLPDDSQEKDSKK